MGNRQPQSLLIMILIKVIQKKKSCKYPLWSKIQKHSPLVLLSSFSLSLFLPSTRSQLQKTQTEKNTFKQLYKVELAMGLAGVENFRWIVSTSFFLCVCYGCVLCLRLISKKPLIFFFFLRFKNDKERERERETKNDRRTRFIRTLQYYIYTYIYNYIHVYTGISIISKWVMVTLVPKKISLGDNLW